MATRGCLESKVFSPDPPDPTVDLALSIEVLTIAPPVFRCDLVRFRKEIITIFVLNLRVAE